MADWNGFKKNGTTYIPNDATARAGLQNKVDKVTGKGLSTNDYDNTAKGIVDNIQDNVIANTKLIKDTAGWSGKNKWDKSKTVGIDATITQTSDGFRAQVSSHTWGSARCDFATPEKNKDFILTCKANVATAGNFMKMQVYGSTDGSDYSNSIAVTDTYSATKELELAFNSGNYNYLRITLYLTNGTATSADVTFEKPMLRDADILDSTYEPYFGSTAFPRSEQAILGAKNLLDPNKLVESAGSDKYSAIYVGNKDVTLSSNIPQNSGNAANLFLLAGAVTSGISTATNGVWEGNPRTVTPIDGYVTVASRIVDNIAPRNYNNLLRLASDTDPTYVPYAMTNKELTEKVTPLNIYSYSKRGGTSFKLKGSVSNLGQSYFVIGQLDGRVSVLSIITTNSGSTEALISNIGTAQLSGTYDNTTLETTVTATANMQNVTVISNENFVLS